MLNLPYSRLPDGAKVEKRFGKGDYVFRQFDKSRAVYFLLYGRVQLQRTLESGHKVVVHLAHKEEGFAEASLFSESYHCDAVCVEDVRLIEVSKNEILRQIQTDGDFALALSELLSKQVQHYRQRLQIASIKSAEDRLMAALAADLPYERITDLAASIGLAHETSYRALSQLVKKGQVIKRGRGHYELANASAKSASIVDFDGLT